MGEDRLRDPSLMRKRTLELARPKVGRRGFQMGATVGEKAKK